MVNVIPFSSVIKRYAKEKVAIKAIESMRKRAVETGVSEMTLDEINEEIRLAREERKQRLEL